MGGMHQRDLVDNTQNVREMCVSLFVRCSFSRRCRWRKPPPYDPAADDTQRSASIPFTDGALDNAARARNSFPFVHRPISRPRPHRRPGRLVLCDSFDAKVWARQRSPICCSIPELTSDSDSGVREMYASIVQDQGPDVRSRS